MTFHIFVECFCIIVIFRINCVISIRNNKLSSIECPKPIINELGEYSVDLDIVELQKRIDLCSSLISQATNELISAKLQLAQVEAAPKKNKKGNDLKEKIDELSKKVKGIGLECNKFVDLILLKRIYCFNGDSLDNNIKLETQVKEKIDDIVDRIVVTENNASFIRSLTAKTKCSNFSESNNCKLLTSKLLFYMAITPKEVIENFENIKLEDI